MSPQCVSCNNQPNDNDSLGGATSESTVTPVVVGIIVGTIAIFILVLFALFYCVKLENERTMRVKNAEQGPTPSSSASETGPAEGGSMIENNGREDDLRVAKSVECGGGGGGGGHPSSSTVVGDREPRADVVAGGMGAGKKRGVFGWGGKKGGGAPADNSPVTAIEMV
ncbi:hypothetical protein VP1G_07384 [Cytospora mali]|uniref:Uncharacterized protein n=1 Tax=Cytospora mali TaxID=578113 RepID=A0A194V8G0_CYTMA|nr:hypothetical protein VP1G_07384 [Valsa mali var. pyri (nom. inval.)]